jgi:hypothetical protein
LHWDFKVICTQCGRLYNKKFTKNSLCGESLSNDEELHLHHKKPKKQGGGDNHGTYSWFLAVKV